MIRTSRRGWRTSSIFRDGDIDWKEIHKALGEIEYNGTATVELSRGNREYLADVSKRVDSILEGG